MQKVRNYLFLLLLFFCYLQVINSTQEVTLSWNDGEEQRSLEVLARSGLLQEHSDHSPLPQIIFTLEKTFLQVFLGSSNPVGLQGTMPARLF